MPRSSDLYDVENEAVVLRVHVQPRAGRSAVVGRHGASLKVRVAAPPLDGRANDAAATLLADTFGVKTKDVELVSGPSSRMKRFQIRGVDVDEFAARLRRVLSDAESRVGEPRRRF